MAGKPGRSGRRFKNGPTGPVEYSTAHQRVKRVRGRAADHQCIGCGAPATQWAWGHRGDAVTCVKTPVPGRSYTVTYSCDPADYDPMCGPCHWAKDRS